MSESLQSRLSSETGITAVDDAALIRAYLELGDAASLSELIRRHQIPVYRLLTALLANPDRAESACEEVFVRAAHRLRELDPHGDVELWLTAVAREVAGELAANDEPLPDPRGLDATLAEGDGREVVRGAVRRALASLSPAERSVLLLVELHGEPLDRAAATLGMPPSEVHELLQRARKSFAAAFRQPRTEELEATAAEPVVAKTQSFAVEHACEGYAIGDTLGAGGMGQVFRARHLASGTERAVKVLLSELAPSTATLARFQREGVIGQPLRHPHLVEVYEVGKTHRGAPFIAMELVDGKSVAARLAAERRLGLEEALHIMRQLLTALGYLHARGIVHRDVKPDNVMLIERDGDPSFVKLLDLGIARVPHDDPTATRLTAAGMTLGTPAYISPEQALGSKVDGRADLYSATVMLFEMLTGKLPFESEDAGSMLAKHVSLPPPRLRHRGLSAPQPLEVLVARGLCKQPYDRYDDADAYLAALAGLPAGH